MGICADPEEGWRAHLQRSVAAVGPLMTLVGLAPMAMLLTYGCGVKLEGETSGGGKIRNGWRARDKEVFSSGIPSLCRM